MLFELAQAKLLIDSDPLRRTQRACPNPHSPEWKCAECMVTSTNEDLPSMGFTQIDIDHPPERCPTCHSIHTREAYLPIAERSIEYVDDNILMQELDQEIDTTLHAHNDASDNEDDEMKNDTQPALATINHRMTQIIDAGIQQGDIPIRIDKCAHIIVSDFSHDTEITEDDIIAAYKDKDKPRCKGCNRLEKNHIAIRTHERSCYWVKYMNNTQPRDSSSDISDDNADDTDRTSHQWSIRQILDVRGGGEHPRFWLIWWQNTTQNGTTTRTFQEPTIGNGTSKETWILDRLVDAPKLKGNLLKRLKARHPHPITPHNVS